LVSHALAAGGLGLGAAGSSFALADTRTTFDAAFTSLEMEEFFALGCRRGGRCPARDEHLAAVLELRRTVDLAQVRA
jgi:hypothetical protein